MIGQNIHTYQHLMDTMVKQMNPALSYQLQEFRASAEGSCLEVMYLS